MSLAYHHHHHHYHVPGSFLCTAGGFPRGRGVVLGQTVAGSRLPEGCLWNRTPDMGRTAEIQTGGRNYRLWPGEAAVKLALIINTVRVNNNARLRAGWFLTREVRGVIPARLSSPPPSASAPSAASHWGSPRRQRRARGVPAPPKHTTTVTCI